MATFGSHNTNNFYLSIVRRLLQSWRPKMAAKTLHACFTRTRKSVACETKVDLDYRPRRMDWWGNSTSAISSRAKMRDFLHQEWARVGTDSGTNLKGCPTSCCCEKHLCELHARGGGSFPWLVMSEGGRSSGRPLISICGVASVGRQPATRSRLGV